MLKILLSLKLKHIYKLVMFILFIYVLTVIFHLQEYTRLPHGNRPDYRPNRA